MYAAKHTGICESILEVIGNTPLVRLGRLGRGLEGSILAKCEYLNPSGSTKDRMALRMVQDAEENGLLAPGTTITEASSGNTAQALAMVAAVRGYALKVRFPEAIRAPEKVKALDRYGAQCELVSAEDEETNTLARNVGLHGATIELPGRLKCLREEESTPNHRWMRQFSNPANPAAQSDIGSEILAQTGDQVDVFVASIGTGGTFLGVSRVLKAALPHVRCVAVEPDHRVGEADPLSPLIRYIPGISGGLLQTIRDSGIADDIVHVSNEEARAMAYRLSREEGIYCGMSSGANVHVAMLEAAKPEMRGKHIVTLIVDRGERYLTDERYTT